ncbi:hypothetical protein FNH05_28245 [Amycolatopsis rhizosphaerae]|uniref:Uncharacterized protein n=1 Tax=Amycolatopsis rhizosphaerae TaxID=2053003 RepID=A0A558B4U9_9PSEU|nr:hypothetical protein [Amycolatopsis rhizosphaerae]TVT31542.1 hypothetical protein FNH05_28245 [Amycolatopsis rhizosphaerae]
MADDNTTSEQFGSSMAVIFGGEQQVNKMADDAGKLLADAKAGKWAVDEETGTHLKRAVTRIQDRLADIGRRANRLERAPMLGNDDYAQRVAQHFQNAMIADDQALIPVFRKTRESLDMLKQAFDEAIKHYDASDEAAARHFGPFEDRGPS